MKMKKTVSDSGRVRRCDLVFTSTANQKLFEYRRLRESCKKMRGTNMVHEIGLTETGLLRLSFGSGYFGGRQFNKEKVLARAAKLLEWLAEEVLETNQLACYLTLREMANKPLGLNLMVDPDPRPALKTVRRIFDANVATADKFISDLHLEASRLITRRKNDADI